MASVVGHSAVPQKDKDEEEVAAMIGGRPAGVPTPTPEPSSRGCWPGLFAGLIIGGALALLAQQTVSSPAAFETISASKAMSAVDRSPVADPSAVDTSAVADPSAVDTSAGEAAESNVVPAARSQVGSKRVLPLAEFFGEARVADSIAKQRRWTYDSVTNLELLYNANKGKKGAVTINHLRQEPALPTHNHERFDLLGPVGPTCPEKLTKLGRGDDEKRFCGKKFLKEPDCVVISVGSNGQWAFEQAIFRESKCTVHTFDCTGVWTPPKEIRSRVKFHNLCVGAKNGGKFRTWDALLKEVGLDRSPSLVKMDIEGYEWETLLSVFSDGSDNMLPDQIALELHYCTHIGAWAWRTRGADEVALFQRAMFQSGYHLIDRHDNPYCNHCTEILIAKLHERV